ncbi:MAG: carboxyl transferase domain-containing protein [Burkholderiaceae bacterium]
MSFAKILIANRGEIAVRIARAAGELGIRVVAVHSRDDDACAHVRQADEAIVLPASGARAYLDVEAIVAAARDAGCDALHPGYGFLSENPVLARRCVEAGITFIGPGADLLALFGNKVRARALAQACGVPLVAGSEGAVSLSEAQAFLAGLGPAGAIMIKAVAGGGGRGMRAVRHADELAEAYARCRSEAMAAFGQDAVYVERLIPAARHIEVQIIADAAGTLAHLWERECTIQRRHQKLVEVAPSPWLPDSLRSRLTEAALALAGRAGYCNLGTFEFLVDTGADPEAPDAFAFIEANPRLQVEHTVTEAVLGIDLVQAQIRVAAGATLADLGLAQGMVGPPRGHAIQLRVNMETLDETGATHPSGGTLAAFQPPAGPGIRVDTFGYPGYLVSSSFDSLLAKLIAHAPVGGYGAALDKAGRALREFRVDGVATNIGFLEALLAHPEFRADRIDTRFIDRHVAELVKPAARGARLYAQLDDEASAHAGQNAATPAARAVQAPAGTVAVTAPLQGTVVSIDVEPGASIAAGASVAIIEAMKMEHLVGAPVAGVVRLVVTEPGVTLMPGEPIVFIEPAEVSERGQAEDDTLDLDRIRPDLAESIERHALTLDAQRPKAVARRRATGQRTARENLAQLFDAGTFIEYGALAIAGQRRRRELQDLIVNTPTDGLIAGTGAINGDRFEEDAARCMGILYDYTVLAGTQGQMNHKKQDRMFRLAERWRIPVVLYAEGGGGRPGETDRLGLTGLDNHTFSGFARLSGLVPLVGVVSGYCFAGNAALLGCCDVIIATRNASIGMGGPAMIEGGGLGVYHPKDVGPVAFQVPNGVIDVLVEDEVQATEAARKYLGYFQGGIGDWQCDDQRQLRHLIPENRLRVYDVRRVIESLADSDSVFELRPGFGIGIVTALIRIEGKPFGLIANNPHHLGGAIDADAGDKAARFMQICDAFGLPIISLCDTPGFMVGPEAEKTALVRHVSRMFVVGASISVPWFTVVLRKGYGLGAQAMSAGGFHDSVFTIAWPTGEFGGMGLEGFVRLGYRKEMEAIADPVERQRWYEQMVAKKYEEGKALSIASVAEIDEVIDPADTRQWLLSGLRSVAPIDKRRERRRPCIDTW